jgi:hypothetical protein
MVSRYILRVTSLQKLCYIILYRIRYLYSIHNRHNATTLHRYLISIGRYNANNIFFKYFMKKCIEIMYRCSVVTIMYRFMYRILFQIVYRKKWRAIQNYICSVVIFVDTLGTCNFCCMNQIQIFSFTLFNKYNF